MLQEEFTNYINTKVISKVKIDKMGNDYFFCLFECFLYSDIYYVGLPPKNYPHFKKLADHLLSGTLLETIGKEEALDIAPLQPDST